MGKRRQPPVDYSLRLHEAAEQRSTSGAISRQHCQISIGDDGATLRDLGSSNGTTVDNQDITNQEATSLTIGPLNTQSWLARCWLCPSARWLRESPFCRLIKKTKLALKISARVDAVVIARDHDRQSLHAALVKSFFGKYPSARSTPIFTCLNGKDLRFGLPAITANGSVAWVTTHGRQHNSTRNGYISRFKMCLRQLRPVLRRNTRMNMLRDGRVGEAREYHESSAIFD